MVTEYYWKVVWYDFDIWRTRRVHHAIVVKIGCEMDVRAALDEARNLKVPARLDCGALVIVWLRQNIPTALNADGPYPITVHLNEGMDYNAWRLTSDGDIFEGTV